MNSFSLDRIEENLAVLVSDDGKTFAVKMSDLPENVQVGDVLIKNENVFTIDNDETEKRKERIMEKRKKLFGK